jgi:hypothetical protein
MFRNDDVLIDVPLRFFAVENTRKLGAEPNSR